MDALWNDLHDLFDTDDGSLPEIRITNLSADSISTIYDMIRTVAKTFPGEPEFWDKRRDQASPLGASQMRLDLLQKIWRNRSILSRRASRSRAHHYRISAYSYSKIRSRSITAWVRNGMQQCCTLFALFKQIRQVAPVAHITLEDAVIPIVRQRFESAVNDYLTSSHE
jgi:hypothetical protein